MNILQFPNEVGGAQRQPEELAREVRIRPENRTSLSGPGMRTFREIAKVWNLSEAAQIALLGEPGRSTFHQWSRKAREGDALTLPLDTLTRISAVLGIYKALTILFEDSDQAKLWLHGAHRGTVFAGASPMEHALTGGMDGLMTVRRYLDAWRGGAMGHGAGEGDFIPVAESDLVFA